MKYNRFSQKLASFFINKAGLSFILGLLLLAIGFLGASKLTSNFSYRIWFKQDNPKLKEFDAFERRFGSDEVGVIVVNSPSGIFDKDSISLLIDLTNDLWQAPEVIRVDSLTNYNWAHADGNDLVVEPFIDEYSPITSELLNNRAEIAKTHRTIEGYLVNKSADTALIYVTLKPALNGTPDYEKVTQAFRHIVSKYEDHSDHTFYLTGNPVLSFAFKESTSQDMARLMPIVLLICFTFLWLTLRRFSGVILVLTIVFASIIGGMGYAGFFHIQLHNLTSIVPQFLVAIAMAIGVHLLVTYYQLLPKFNNKEEALMFTVQKNITPTLLTSISTSLGFFSFLTASIPTIIDMGIMAGLGTLFSWLFSYLILVPLVKWLPERSLLGRLFSRNRKKEDAHHSPEEIEEMALTLEPSSRSISYTKWVQKYRIPIISLFGAVTIVMGVLATHVPVNSDPFNYFDKSYFISKATHFVEDKVGGAMGAEIVIDSGKPEGIKDPEFMNRVEEFQNWLDSFPFVSKTVSVVNILKEMNQSLNGGEEAYYTLPQTRDLTAQLLFLYTMNLPVGMDINNRLSLQNDSIRLTAMWTIHDSATVMALIDEIEAKAQSLGLDAHVTGKAPLYQSNNTLVVKSFVVSFSLAMALIAILMMIGLKSVKTGLMSLIPNTLPLIMGAGVLYLMGQPLDIGTVIVGSVCLGIAVDDTIHFLTNFKHYKDHGDDDFTAVARVLTYTGPALVTTTLVLVTAFATFAFATFVPNQNFGILVAIILTLALLADVILLPALLLKPTSKK